ncbi:PREDICTED: olfactory receptor 2AT4-like [Cyprinodon variegatus]|uniref:olfactory receptor 2AT4-like n=1 Tax=Cyprinodon variegatus TaxID=28743 RepID=UPI000742B38B|nr:PREDICTED: olfactory receptor 2AT4-like [Cyprinodon variegatus]
MLLSSNITRIQSFIILGFPGLSPQYHGAASAVLFLVYLAIVVGNIFILVFVISEKSLQKPTYLIFCHLALTDLSFGTVTLPKIISKYWFKDSIISFFGCFTQMFFVHYLGSVMSFLLLVMAVDRFIAICIPLRYPVLITNNNIFALCGFAWFIPLPLMIIVTLQALGLPYCQSNTILQCYCDHISLTNQACGNDLKIVQVITLCIAMFCLLLPLAFILISYVSIIIVILKMSNSAGRSRTLGTCTPQIFITCLFYLPRCFVYVANTVRFSFSIDVRILLILLYSLLPAAVNPLIYCLKTRDIKRTLMKRIKTNKIRVELKIRNN